MSIIAPDNAISKAQCATLLRYYANVVCYAPSSPPNDNYTNPILSGSFSFRSKTHTHKREMSQRVKTFYLIYTRLKYKSNIRSYYVLFYHIFFSTCQVSNVHNRGHLKRFSFQFKGSHVKLIICSFFSNQLFEFLLYDNTPFIYYFLIIVSVCMLLTK